MGEFRENPDIGAMVDADCMDFGESCFSVDLK